MATFLNPQGVEVSQADAMIGGTLRPGFKKILSDGEYIHSNIMMMDSMRLPDAKTKGGDTSIDAALRAAIATLAKQQGLTPADFLATMPLAELQKLAAETASNVLETMSGQGVAAKLADEKRQREVTDMLRKARYSGYGSFIEAADGENPVRPTIPSGMSPTDATAYLRKARYAQ